MLSVPAGRFHDIKCATEYAQNRTRADKNKKISMDIAKRKKSLKTRSAWTRDAQKVVNEYVRLRDMGKPCISCGSINNQPNMIDAGHYRSRGAAPHMRFYTLNIMAQCVRCNRNLSGNTIEMRKGMISRLGRDKVESIESMQFDSKPDIEYLKRLIKTIRRKIRIYKKLRKNN